MSVKKPTEQSIVNACLDLLAYRGAFAWRVNQGAMKTAAGGFVRFNRVKGISDIVGVLPSRTGTLKASGAPYYVAGGKMICVEVKRPGLGNRSKPEPHQQLFLDIVRDKGGLAVCVTSVAELDALLTLEGY